MHGIHNAIEADIEENANYAFTEATPYENPRVGTKGLHNVRSAADLSRGAGPPQHFGPKIWALC